MTDTWDDEDRAIAQALGAEGPESAGPADPAVLADYENVVAQLPFDPVAPRAELEDRVVAAALARRPAAARAISAGPSRRAARRSLPVRAIVAGASAAAAVVIIVVLAVGRPPTGGPGARIQPANAGASVASVLAEPGARRGVLQTGAGAAAGRVVLGLDGRGFVYDLAPARSDGAQWLWLDTTSGPARVGRLPGASKTVFFVVRGRIAAVNGVFITSEPAVGTPTAPGPVVARASFS